MAFATASMSFPSGTRSTCQPYAAKRPATSSLKQIEVLPASDTRLSS